MAFLYVGLGIVMITGISAMIQIGNNVNNLLFLSVFKKSEYYQSEYLPSYDRRIMSFLEESAPDSDVCSEVKQKINNTLTLEEGEYIDNEGGSSIKIMTPSNNEFLENSCVLVNNDNRHRVLINKSSNQSSFNLFTCYFEQKKPECPYEVN